MSVKIHGDNSASACGFATGDGDTGIMPGSDVVDVVTGGTSRINVTNSATKVTNTLKVGNIQNDGASAANVVLNSDTSISIPGAIKHVGDDDTLIEFETNKVKLQTNGSTRVEVDSSGRTLIGANEPVTANFASAKLQVNNDGDRVASFMYAVDNGAGPHVNIVKSRGGATDLSTRKVLNNNDELGRLNFIGDDGADLGCDGAAIIAKIDGTPASNNMPTELLFYTNDGVQFAEERMKIGKAGDVTITDGNLVIGSGGHGIDFSNATDVGTGETSQATLLDDYEVGTWVPTLGSGGNTFTHSFQDGSYSKVGRQVTISCQVTFKLTTIIHQNAQATISGLPFPIGAKDTGVTRIYWEGAGSSITGSGYNIYHNTWKPTSINTPYAVVRVGYGSFNVFPQNSDVTIRFNLAYTTNA